MSNESTALVVVGDDFSPRQVEIIKNQIAKGASDGDLALFLEVCKMTGLNPFQRQIYAVMRNAKEKTGPGQNDWATVQRMTIQTGIDGYRLVAARTGQLAGIDDPIYDRDDDEPPNRASVTVWRMVGGQRVPFTATARWREYAQMKDEYVNDKKTGKKKPTEMWERMPYLMLGKCAEALALRKAFPAELSGVYTGEEMQQADADYAPYVEASAPPKRSEPTPLREVKPQGMPRDSWGDLQQRAARLGVKDWPAFVVSLTGKDDPKSYTAKDRQTVAVELARREEPDFEFTVAKDEAGDGEGGIPSDALKRVPVSGIGA